MAERVDQLIPYGYAETWIGTFHAFGDHVLRESALEIGLSPEFRVLTRPEQIIFLRERLWQLPLQRYRPLGDPTRHLSALLGLVSRAKDEDVSPERYREWAEARAATARRRRRGADEAERHLELAAFYAALPDADRGGGRRRFRRPDLAGARPPARASLRPGQAARALPLRPGGRVPGHEPRPARAGAPARRRATVPTSPSSATTTRPSTAGAAPPRPTSWPSAGSTRRRARWC